MIMRSSYICCEMDTGRPDVDDDVVKKGRSSRQTLALCALMLTSHSGFGVCALAAPGRTTLHHPMRCSRVSLLRSHHCYNFVTNRDWRCRPHCFRYPSLRQASEQPVEVESAVSSTPPKQQEGASIRNLSTSLVKSIVGAGVLALPAGVATLGDTLQQALPTALLFIAATGMMNAYFFSLLGRVCSATGAASYSQAWDRTVGKKNSQAVAFTVTFKTALSCLAYSMILADSFQSLAVATGLFPDVTRTTALLTVTLTALLPLCLQRDLSSLAPFSLAGLLGFGVAAVTMVTRCFDGSYYYAPGYERGPYLADLPSTLQPAFGDNASIITPDAQGIVLLCTLATAFVAHYNAPRFHAELHDNTVQRFNTVVGISFGIAAALFAVVAVTGFATFGSHAQPLILNNFSPYDPLAAASRAAIATSILLTFPLPFVGLRDGVLEALRVDDDDRSDTSAETNITVVTVALLAAVTVAALVIQDLSFVLSVGGGTFSTAVSSIFPTLMFRAAVKNQRELLTSASSDNDLDTAKMLQQSEFDANLALLLMTISISIGVTGVSIALNNMFHWF